MLKNFSKIAVIGDIHAEHERLEVLIEFLKSQQPDKIFSAGDVVDGPGSVNRCCELLQTNQILTTLGNHDAWCLQHENRSVEHATLVDELSEQSREFLASLPKIHSVKTAAGKAMLCHGLGENNMASVRPGDSMDDIYRNIDLWAMYKTPDLRFIFNGHSHQPGVYEFNHLTVINAGALCDQDIASAVLIDFKLGTADFFDTDEKKQIKHCMSKAIKI